MRTLLVIRDLDLGGAQRQLVLIGTGLARRHHDVVVACWRAGGAMSGDLRRRGIKLVELSPRRRGDISYLASQLRQVVRDECIQVAYSMMPVENLVTLLACRGTRAKLVWGVRTSPGAVRGMRVTQRLLFWIQRLLAWAPDAVVANSAAGVGLVSWPLSRSRVSVIRNGVDTDRFASDDQLRVSARNTFGIQEGAWVVAAVGRLEPQKGIEDLLIAVSTFAVERPGIICLLVGRMTSEYGSLLAERIRAAGLEHRVRILPPQDDVRPIYLAADVLVSPSHGEGMSNVVAEAMACGLPVIATRVGDNETLIDEAGWLYDPGDVGALGRALREIAGADSGVLTGRARDRIRCCFSADALVTETEQLLRSVVGKP